MSREFHATRVALWILAPIAITVVLAIGANNASLAALGAVSVLFVGGLTCPIALVARASVVDRRLSARVPASGSPVGFVYLDRLSSVESVGRKYGNFVRAGMSIWRPYYLIEDDSGNQVWMAAWGWNQPQQVRDLLRIAVEQSGAKTDELTRRRLGLNGTIA